jgi:hypothetical protein
MKAWGDLFGRFAVQAVPHAVAVNGKEQSSLAASSWTCSPGRAVWSRRVDEVGKQIAFWLPARGITDWT